MNGNLNPSTRVGVLALLAPAAQAAGTQTTAWVDMQDWFSILAIVSSGVLGASATVDAKIQQATDASGTGAKDVTGSAITTIVKANGDNKQALVNLRQDDLDRNGGYRFVRLSLAVGTASSLVSAMLIGLDPRYGAANAHDATSVTEIVG